MKNNYYEKLTETLKERTIIFIDVANLERSVQDMWVNPKDIPNDLKKHTAEELCWRLDYEKFKQFFQKSRDLQDIRFYTADFETKSHRGFLHFLKKTLRFKLQTKPLKEYRDHTPEHPNRKANFDVEIAVDTVDRLNKFDTFVLFSGDCDFAYLLKYLRGKNKTTIIFSRKGHVAKELPPASNYYFDIVDFRNDFLRMEPKSKKSA